MQFLSTLTRVAWVGVGGGITLLCRDWDAKLASVSFSQPSLERVVGVAGDRAILYAVDGFVDREARHQEPLPGKHRLTEPVLDRNVELRSTEYTVDDVLETSPVML